MKKVISIVEYVALAVIVAIIATMACKMLDLEEHLNDMDKKLSSIEEQNNKILEELSQPIEVILDID